MSDDLVLSQRLISWRENCYSLTSKSMIFYDNLGEFDNGVEIRKTRFIEEDPDSSQETLQDKDQQCENIREKMKKNQEMSWQQRRVLYRTLNPLTFGIVFWERYFQCKMEQVKELEKITEETGEAEASHPKQETSLHKSKLEAECIEDMQKEESYSLARLLPEDSMASLNYLGFMISLVSSEYQSQYSKLKTSWPNLAYLTEHQILK